ncbi:LOW QUALITY PROTEIN: hypothetical protein M8C21_029229, partial [Ambrosia artemisiifolia]
CDGSGGLRSPSVAVVWCCDGIICRLNDGLSTNIPLLNNFCTHVNEMGINPDSGALFGRHLKVFMLGPVGGDGPMMVVSGCDKWWNRDGGSLRVRDSDGFDVFQGYNGLSILYNVGGIRNVAWFSIMLPGESYLQHFQVVYSDHVHIMHLPIEALGTSLTSIIRNKTISKHEPQCLHMAFKLSSKLVDAAKGSGDAIRKREEISGNNYCTLIKCEKQDSFK